MSILSSLFGKTASSVGDDVLRNVAAQQSDDVSRGVLSEIGKSLRPKSKFAEMLRSGAETGLNAPMNLTRADVRALSAEGKDPNKTIRTLFERTGTSDVNKLQNISDSLMRKHGDQPSLVSSVVDDMRTNFSRVGDPQNYVDLSDLRERIKSLARDSGMKQSVTDDLGITGSKALDPIRLEKELRSRASTLRGKLNPQADEGMAKLLEGMGTTIRDRIDSSVDPRNIAGGWDIITDNLTHASRKALLEGDKVSADAFKRLAKEVSSIPEDQRTIQGIRSSLADFVSLNKINKKTANSKGGGSLSQRLKSLPVVGDLVDTVLGEPATRASQKTGEAMLKVADSFDSGKAQNMLKNGAAIGGGLAVLGGLTNGGGQAKQSYDPRMMMNGAGMDNGDGTGTTGTTNTAAGASTAEPTVAGYTQSQLENAYVAALMDNNTNAAAAIGNMLDMVDAKQARADKLATTGTKSKQASQSANAARTMNNLMQTYQRGGGAQGAIGALNGLLNKATFGSYNPNQAAYENMLQAAAVAVARANGEVGVLSNQDIQNYKNMLPTFSDNPQQAQIKLQTIMSGLQGME